MQEITLEEAAALLPERPVDAHKGVYGHVLVLAGSRGLLGAGRMVCEAALRSGPGLVTWAAPEALLDIVSGMLMEAMCRGLPDTREGTLSMAALAPALALAVDKQAVVLGPGLGTHPGAVRFVQHFAAKAAVPMVIDADALNALSRRMEALEQAKAPCILTPHPGEMARLLDCATGTVQADRPAAAAQLAERTGKVVVLKGHQTLVARPDGALSCNTSGNSGMATGGTGDVLAGVLGGLIAQGLDPWDAARLGVYAHGRAGDVAATWMTQRGLVAGDVIRALPEAWRELESQH